MSEETDIFDVERENVADNSQTLVKCAICQDVVEKTKASFVDLCFHQYCFDCLKKWCEVKAECPLCKQKIEKIIHDVKSPQTYKEFVPPMTNQSLLRAQLEHSFDFNQTFSSDDDDDGTVFRMAFRAPDLLRMLQPNVLMPRRLNIDTINATDTSSTSNEGLSVEESDESDAEAVSEPSNASIAESDDILNRFNDDLDDELEDLNDVSIIESQQSIISISSDSDSAHSDREELPEITIITPRSSPELW
ncbi:uncharacterized protein LOC129571523 [Sitodiplosis mosellana]|uniref:uncharacterized protein LOC129571523 n=1 Tax=Sitodiplosis mosellana TaxID=263140 RepID=UPI0024452655|nr:uncharacterized protein LOC129571523 [Sitodiplosis mosellana]